MPDKLISNSVSWRNEKSFFFIKSFYISSCYFTFRKPSKFSLQVYKLDKSYMNKIVIKKLSTNLTEPRIVEFYVVAFEIFTRRVTNQADHERGWKWPRLWGYVLDLAHLNPDFFHRFSPRRILYWLAFEQKLWSKL